MSQVRYGQKGYDGVAMSKRARTAYIMGEKPLSKIRREDADALTALINTYAPEYTPAKALTVAQAKDIFKRWGESSYHHTGKYANVTSFYHPSAIFDYYGHPEDFEEELTEENISIFNIRMKKWSQEQA